MWRVVVFTCIVSVYSRQCTPFTWVPRVTGNVSLTHPGDYSFRAAHAFSVGLGRFGSYGIFESKSVSAGAKAVVETGSSCSSHKQCIDGATPNHQTGTGYRYFTDSCKGGGLHCVGTQSGCRQCTTKPTEHPQPQCPKCVCDHYSVTGCQDGAEQVIKGVGISGHAEFEVMAARVYASFKAAPTVAMATFASQANFKAVARSSITSSDPHGDAGAYGAAMAATIAKVVEFDDIDGDRVYDEGKDTLVQTFNFVGDIRVGWDTMCTDTGTDHMFIFNMSTDALSSLDMSWQVEFTDVLGKKPNGDIASPLGSKISVQIKDFPYKSKTKTSQLALLMYMAAAEATVSVGAKVEVDATDSNNVVLGDKSGYFNWKGRATTDPVKWDQEGQGVDIRAGALVNAKTDELKGDTLSAFFRTRVTADTHITAKRAWFAVDANQPNFVYWDPALGAGENPKVEVGDSNSASPVSGGIGTGAIIGIVVGVLVVVALAGVVVFIVMKKKRESVGGDLTDPMA